MVRGSTSKYAAASGVERGIQVWILNLPDHYLTKGFFSRIVGGGHFEDYVRAVHWAQDYALPNRAKAEYAKLQ
jgi:hypothetical protein